MMKPNNISISSRMIMGWLLLFLIISQLTACTTVSLREDTVRSDPSYAQPPATNGPLADIARKILNENGPGASGFKLLDKSYDGLLWRLVLIDSAVSSLDIQTYLWYPDKVGRLILEHAVRAADRGVRVRLIVDDLLTIGLEQLLYELEAHPNLELRLFNPWEHRGTLSRAGEMIAQMERLNTRMHDKLLIADGNAAVVGGRNIGDHYFGLSDAYNFHDLDILGIGHIGRQANVMFDSFWNSEWVVSAKNLETEHDAEFAAKKWQEIMKKNRAAEELNQFGAEPKNWDRELSALVHELHIGTSNLIFDEATADEVNQNVAAKMFNIMGLAKKELLITNAYIIPGQPAIDFIQGLTDRGVRVRILTNSLASHDVPAVNSHYEGWRDDLIHAGAELYELRADAAIQSIVDIAPVKGEFVGLHTKSVVIDRSIVFVGSMNFDPRSFNINTEAGVVVESRELGEALAQIMERDMSPKNSWQVLLDDDGEPYWVSSGEVLKTQPARGGMQRAMNVIFKMFPKDQY
jgi:putative cardiolipin synthase